MTTGRALWTTASTASPEGGADAVEERGPPGVRAAIHVVEGDPARAGQGIAEHAQPAAHQALARFALEHVDPARRAVRGDHRDRADVLEAGARAVAARHLLEG